MAWFKTWFNTPYYHILYKNRDFEEAENFISLLSVDLELPKGAKIIDLACGRGRHSVYLHKLGYDVRGLDLSEESIEHNRQFEVDVEGGPDLKFEVHDMRDPIDGEKVDAVFNLFTSFGYFDDPEDDRKVFCAVKDILKSGGYFVLDFLNERFVKNTLVAESVVLRDEYRFLIEKRIEGDHVIKDIRFMDGDEQMHFFEKVKLHTLKEIDEIAEKCGYQRVKIYGNYSLDSFNIDTSPRCINVFKKIK